MNIEWVAGVKVVQLVKCARCGIHAAALEIIIDHELATGRLADSINSKLKIFGEPTHTSITQPNKPQSGKGQKSSCKSRGTTSMSKYALLIGKSAENLTWQQTAARSHLCKPQVRVDCTAVYTMREGITGVSCDFYSSTTTSITQWPKWRRDFWPMHNGRLWSILTSRNHSCIQSLD